MNVDLRSDTVTRPTPGMLQAMMGAEVGDDVLGDDPTVKALETLAARKFGMEAALFCPSGTMCNQIAVRVHTQPQDQVICDQYAHVYLYEGGGLAFNSGVSVRLLAGERGILAAEQIEEAINPENVHFPRSRLVVLENTANKGGGSFYSMEELRKIRACCQARGLALHMDGARIFNALTAGASAAPEIGAQVDSISVCLSKGLGAPVGSVLIGSRHFIQEAARVRKALGGGMRQSGYLAAAGIYALHHHIDRLSEDHLRAKTLARALEARSWVKNIKPVDTNIVIFEVDPTWKSVEDTVALMEARGIRGLAFGPKEIRWITHLDVTEEMIDYACQTLSSLS